METKAKRYFLEKLIHYDYDKELETWVRTKWCSDNDEVLNLLLADDYRIFDTLNDKELRRNVDLESWK